MIRRNSFLELAFILINWICCYGKAVNQQSFLESTKDCRRFRVEQLWTWFNVNNEWANYEIVEISHRENKNSLKKLVSINISVFHAQSYKQEQNSAVETSSQVLFPPIGAILPPNGRKKNLMKFYYTLGLRYNDFIRICYMSNIKNQVKVVKLVELRLSLTSYCIYFVMYLMYSNWNNEILIIVNIKQK